MDMKRQKVHQTNTQLPCTFGYVYNCACIRWHGLLVHPLILDKAYPGPASFQSIRHLHITQSFLIRIKSTIYIGTLIH